MPLSPNPKEIHMIRTTLKALAAALAVAAFSMTMTTAAFACDNKGDGNHCGGKGSKACPHAPKPKPHHPGGPTTPPNPPITTVPQNDEIAACASQPVARADGTVGIFLDLDAATFASGSYQGVTFTPAYYVDGIGLTCDLPSGYHYVGQRDPYQEWAPNA